MEDVKEIFIDIPQISLEEQEKYMGKFVVIVDGKIAAAGYNSLEAFEKAKKLYPKRSREDFLMDYIPREEALIL